MVSRSRKALPALRRHLLCSAFTYRSDPTREFDRVSVTIVVVACLVIATPLQTLRIGAGNAINSL